MSPELTSVDILDYTLTNHINFEVLIDGPGDLHLLFVCSEHVYAPCEKMVVFHGIPRDVVSPSLPRQKAK